MSKISALTLIILMTILSTFPTREAQAACSGQTPPSDSVAVMFCYTQNVLNNKFGGNKDSLETALDLAVEQINLVWENSGLTTRAYKSNSLQVTYTEIGDLRDFIVAGTPLGSNARAKMKAKMGIGDPVTEIPEDISAEADIYGADAVIMVHGQTFFDTGFILGIGNLKWPEDGVDAPDMCRVAILSDELHGTPAYTMAHELGHATGCSHDRWANAGLDWGWTKDAALSYSTGYIAPATTPRYQDPLPNSIGTVMSYVDVAPDPGLIYPYFSDPDHFEGAENMGTDMNWNVRTLEETLPLVIAHRSVNWSLDPATVDFSTTVGAQTGSVTIDFTTSTEIPSDGKIAITFPPGFKFNVTELTGVSDLTGLDGAFNMVISGDTITLERAGGDPVSPDTDIGFSLSNIDNPERREDGYSGNFCYQTFDGADTLLDQNLLVEGTVITQGTYPEPTFPRPPRFRDKTSATDRLGCLVAEGAHILLMMALAITAFLTLALRPNKAKT